MTIFLTGGSGKVARRVAEQIEAAGGPEVLRASRSPSPEKLSSTVPFDWSDRTTFESPFQHPYNTKSSISSVLIVLPARPDPDEDVLAFVHLAIEHGVLHFVLLSTAICPPDPSSFAPHARIHHRLQEIHAHNPKVRVSVLRPSFFMQNFSEAQHLATIREQGTIFSATGTGTEAFISCDDIASVAVKCLLNRGESRDYYIVGPKAVSYDEIAKILSSVTGKTITHTNLSKEDFVQQKTAQGLPEKYAEMLAGVDIQIANGHGEKANTMVEEVLGRPAISFEAFANKTKGNWL